VNLVAKSFGELPARLNAAWGGFWQKDEARPYRVMTLAVVLFGILLRAIGTYVDASSFWYDEAAWAHRLHSRTFINMAIRPIAFMWVTLQLANTFGASEVLLRLLPNLASMFALLLMPYIASQLIKNRAAQVLLVLLWALQPALIDYAKEFKPYSVEVLVHLIPLVLYLRYRETDRIGYFWAFVIVLPILFPFTYNIAFAYPALLLWALIEAWKKRRYKGAAAVMASGLACLALVVGLYQLTLHRVPTQENETYWGKKYDVFYTTAQSEGAKKSHAAWLADKYTDMASLPGLRRDLWRPPVPSLKGALKALARVDRTMWLALHFLGLGYLFAKRRELFFIMTTPYFVLIAVNAAGKWPIGAFRTNLFLCAYILPIAVIGFDWLANHTNRRTWAALGAVAAITLVPGFAFGFDIRQPKSFWGARSHQERLILEKLRGWREEHLRERPNARPERLILDCHTWHSHIYYLKYNPSAVAQYKRFFRSNFILEKGCFDETKMKRIVNARLKREKQPFWVIVTKPAMMEPIDTFLREKTKIVKEERLGTDHVIYLIERRDPPQLPPMAPPRPDAPDAPDAPEPQDAVPTPPSPSARPSASAQVQDDDPGPPADPDADPDGDRDDP
jgi:4-amino-4-deoxy-L-arabinose transferase-like glycosyltransferase